MLATLGTCVNERKDSITADTEFQLSHCRGTKKMTTILGRISEYGTAGIVD
jgi:hypothetical protein